MTFLEKISNTAGKYFAVWVVLAAAIGLISPTAFQWVLPQIALLLGIIMFGMGMTLKGEDFKLVFSRPKEVIFGVIAQYTLMPLIAYGIAVIFNLPPDLAVGVILVGTCPGGTSSNVMTYLAKGDLALSVSMTSVSTLLAPFLTPMVTLWLAGKWIPISATALFISIVKIVLVPIILGLIARKFFGNAVNTGIKILPLISVVSIVLIVGGVVGVNAERILSTALTIFMVVILHNMLGYLLGYFIASKLKMGEAKRRAVAIEVGMQNSGLAVSLAMTHFNPVAAIPAAIFSVWHNISGPLLATFWSNKTNSLDKSNA
ncbi:bile acid:sodium symporter family protein [Crassaminicella profunda]|uniref:bile acid:sodium symporter family protein n=1 Tax=Crassaminicella profunda TaxID=1286698 RepID=UPI001CA67D9D|nr:bile acid:sodium symporter family protein [Crassaminicella profunda]QZY55759.1 bile acid:sodium symporter family protein [Crassaminicella profunda]